MKPIAQPVSIRQPEIGALVAGTMNGLIRPDGRMAVLQPGDILWVREPFHLPKAFAHLRPTSAVNTSAEPVFVADHDQRWLERHVDELGRRRHAREMPKAWHRQHLVITGIDRRPLHELAADAAVLRAAGWPGRDAFMVRWDKDATFDGSPLRSQHRWEKNPGVLHIRFTRVAKPIPGYDSRACAIAARATRRQRAEAPMSPPFMRTLPEPDRSPCPRCGVRRDRGCEHHPLVAEAAR